MKAYRGIRPYAFMSYSHRDEDRILKLVEKLQSVGCNIWYDAEILPAEEWAERIGEKIASASIFFLVISKNSIESQYVKKELSFAISKDIPILTFYLEDVELSNGLAMQLVNSQAVYTKNNIDIDCNSLRKGFPEDTKAVKEPEVIIALSKYIYAFYNEEYKNQYSIIQIDRDTKQKKVLFLHKDSTAFSASYKCESIHFSYQDEFNCNNEDTLFFSVYSDLDHEPGVATPNLYIQADFLIKNPNSKMAELIGIGGRYKNKQQPFKQGDYLSKESLKYWFKNEIDND